MFIATFAFGFFFYNYYPSLANLNLDDRIIQTGKVTTGKIINRYAVKNRKVDNLLQQHIYKDVLETRLKLGFEPLKGFFVLYSYEVDNKICYFYDNISEDDFMKLSPGMPLKIHYMEDLPCVSVCEYHISHKTQILVMSVSFLVLGCLLVFIAIRYFIKSKKNR